MLIIQKYINNLINQSFERLEVWKEEFLAAAFPEDPINFPFIIVGNKIDLAQSNRAVSTSKALSWCDTAHVNVLFLILAT